MNIWGMIMLSIIAGSLSTMNLWVAKRNDIRFHLNDVYMVLLMTSWMILLERIYYYSHYKNHIPLILSGISTTVLIYFVQKQMFIDDSQYMKGMIPHHSMAITMSKAIKEKSTDQQIINFANNIINTQEKEIAYIKKLGY